MSDATTTTTPIAAFKPENRFVTFEGLKDYDANLISNLHSLGYNNKVSGANIFAWGNNNQIDGKNLFVFGNWFTLTSIAKRPSMFIGDGSVVSEEGWNDTENTIFGVWHEYSSTPIFRVGAEETVSDEDQLDAAFSIRSNGSFSAAQNKFIVNANGSFSAANGLFSVDGSVLKIGGSSENGQIKSLHTLDLSGTLVRVVDSQFTVLNSSNLGSMISISSISPFTVRSASSQQTVFEITPAGAIATMRGKTTSYVTLRDLLTPPEDWDTSKISVLVVLDS